MHFIDILLKYSSEFFIKSFSGLGLVKNIEIRCYLPLKIFRLLKSHDILYYFYLETTANLFSIESTITEQINI